MGNCSTGSSEDTLDSKSQLLTQSDIANVKHSWTFVVKSGLKENGVNMMIRIFVEHKELKPLWRFAKNLDTTEQMHGNQLLKAHGEKLFTAVDMVVNSLEDFSTLVPILIQLGFSHHRWGVRDEHFPFIGEALIGTLQDGLKEEFNEKVKKSWLKLFGIIVFQMKIGMRQAENEMNKLNANPDIEVTKKCAIETHKNTNSTNNGSI